jgi:hypothetical protein
VAAVPVLHRHRAVVRPYKKVNDDGMKSERTLESDGREWDIMVLDRS